MTGCSGQPRASSKELALKQLTLARPLLLHGFSTLDRIAKNPRPKTKRSADDSMRSCSLSWESPPQSGRASSWALSSCTASALLFNFNSLRRDLRLVNRKLDMHRFHHQNPDLFS